MAVTKALVRRNRASKIPTPPFSTLFRAFMGRREPPVHVAWDFAARAIEFRSKQRDSKGGDSAKTIAESHLPQLQTWAVEKQP